MNFNIPLRFLDTCPMAGVSVVSSLFLSVLSPLNRFGSHDIADILLKVMKTPIITGCNKPNLYDGFAIVVIYYIFNNITCLRKLTLKISII